MESYMVDTLGIGVDLKPLMHIYLPCPLISVS
jgi:hypothetical protein